MKSLIKYSLILFFGFASIVQAKEIFFNEAKILFEKENYNESKFLFQRSIVFNPKDAKSYLFLAKIFKIEGNEREEIKNLNTAILLEPNNEEAIYMLIDLELKRSNFSKVKKLTNDFKIICSTLCDKTDSIQERLKDIEVKNNS